MSLATSYLFLGIAVFLGVTSNSFAKTAEGFTLLFPSIITAITIVLCIANKKTSKTNFSTMTICK